MALIDVSPDPDSRVYVDAERIVTLYCYNNSLVVAIRDSGDGPHHCFAFPAEWNDAQQQDFIRDLAAQINASRR